MFPTSDGETYVVVDVKDTETDGGNNYVQAIISIDPLGNSEAVYERIHFVDSFFVTQQVSIDPDGEKVAIIGYNSSQQLSDIVIVDLDTGQEVFSQTNASPFCNPIWSDENLFYGIVIPPNSCLRRRSFNQPVNRLYGQNTETGDSWLVTVSEETIYFLPRP